MRRAIGVKGSTVIALILVLSIFSSPYPNVQAQASMSLSPSNQFPIPAYKGNVNFAVNGNYTMATLENDSWTFQNLSLAQSSSMKTFLVSAQNSNITIYSYIASNNTAQNLRLRYFVEGRGKQIFNFGQGGSSNAIDWNVVITKNGRNTFLAPRIDFTISRNGTVVVNGVTGNCSISRFAFSINNLRDSNLPFYEKHYVALTTIAVIAIVFVLAVAVALRNNKKPSEKESGGMVRIINNDIESRDRATT